MYKLPVILLILLTLSFAYIPSDYLKLDHTEVGFGSACSYYNVSNPTLSVVSPKDANALRINRFVEVKGSIKTSYWEFLEKNVPYTVQVWQSNVSCTITANLTEVCTDKGKYLNETRYRDEWKTLDTTKLTLAGKETKQVRFCGTFDMQKTADGWGVALDHIPEFMGNIYDGVLAPRYDWWNATWPYCMQDTLTAPFDANYSHKISLNTTNFAYAHANSDLSDLRILEGTCTTPNTTAGELGIYNETINTSGQSDIWVKTINANAPSVAIYYGNPTATSTFWCDNAFLLCDEFSGSSLNSTLWQQSGGTVTVGGGTMNYSCAAGNCFVNSTRDFSYNVTMETNSQIDNTGENYLSYGFGFFWGTNHAVITDNSGSDTLWYASTKKAGVATGSTSANIATFTGFNITWTNSWVYFERGSATYNQTDTAKIPVVSLNLSLSGSNPANHRTNWARVRKWQTTPPAQAFGAEESANAAPFVVSINITPAAPYTPQNLSCNYVINDTDSPLLNVTGYWYKNGALQTALNFTRPDAIANATYANELSHTYTTQFENWSCGVNATDGIANSALNLSANVTILNHPPSGTPSVTPAFPTFGKALSCAVTITDVDSDLMDGSLIWFNGTVIYSSQAFSGQATGTLLTMPLAAGTTWPGDSWLCELNVSDGFNQTWTNSSAVTILAGSAPAISSLALSSSYPSLTCSATLSDAEGDSITGNASLWLNGSYSGNYTTFSGTGVTYTPALNTTVGDVWSCLVYATDGYNTASSWSSNVTVTSSGYTTNVTFSHTYVWSDFEGYVTTFYSDWDEYILSLIVFAISFILGKSYSQIFLMSGVGLFAVFVLTLAPVVLAASVLMIMTSMLVKYVTGV